MGRTRSISSIDTEIKKVEDELIKVAVHAGTTGTNDDECRNFSGIFFFYSFLVPLFVLY